MKIAALTIGILLIIIGVGILLTAPETPKYYYFMLLSGVINIGLGCAVLRYVE